MYEERFRSVNLTTLETRRLRDDLIEVFKIFKGFENLDSMKYFKLSTALTRSHSLKLVKSRCRSEVTKFSMQHRVVGIWTSLDGAIVAYGTISSSKKRLDKFPYGPGFI